MISYSICLFLFGLFYLAESPPSLWKANIVTICCCCSVTNSCPTLCDPRLQHTRLSVTLYLEVCSSSCSFLQQYPLYYQFEFPLCSLPYSRLFIEIEVFSLIQMSYIYINKFNSFSIVCMCKIILVY